MDDWNDPKEPGDPAPDDPREPRPIDGDPETQRAPGAGEDDPDTTDGDPPMQAANEIVLDGPGVASEPVGNDNIREGRVGGVMGPPHASQGQGQGG